MAQDLAGDARVSSPAPVPGGDPGGAVPERPLRGSPRSTGRLSRVPDVASVVLAGVALFSLATALSAMLHRFVAPVVDLVDPLLLNLPSSLSAAAFYGVLAAAAERRKRVGWWGIVVVAGLHLLGSVVLAFALWFAPAEVFGPDPLGTEPSPLLASVLVAVQLVVFVLFVAARRHFPTRVRRGAVWRALAVLVLGLLLAAVVGFAVVSLFPGSLRTPESRAEWTFGEVTGSQVPSDLPGLGAPPRPVALVLGVLGTVALLAPLFVLVRSQRAASVLSPDAEIRLRQLLRTYGEADSLGYFATRRDKAAIFAPAGKAAVTYRVVAGVSLASGDPIGDPDHWGPAIDGWIAEARAYAWIPAVMGAGEAGATAYRRAGLKVLEIGDEAVLNTARFDLAHPDLRQVRQTVQRLRAAGYTVRIRRHGDLSRAGDGPAGDARRRLALGRDRARLLDGALPARRPGGRRLRGRRGAGRRRRPRGAALLRALG